MLPIEIILHHRPPQLNHITQATHYVTRLKSLYATAYTHHETRLTNYVTRLKPFHPTIFQPPLPTLSEVIHRRLSHRAKKNKNHMNHEILQLCS